MRGKSKSERQQASHVRRYIRSRLHWLPGFRTEALWQAFPLEPQPAIPARVLTGNDLHTGQFVQKKLQGPHHTLLPRLFERPQEWMNHLECWLEAAKPGVHRSNWPESWAVRPDREQWRAVISPLNKEFPSLTPAVEAIGWWTWFHPEQTAERLEHLATWWPFFFVSNASLERMLAWTRLGPPNESLHRLLAHWHAPGKGEVHPLGERVAGWLDQIAFREKGILYKETVEAILPDASVLGTEDGRARWEKWTALAEKTVDAGLWEPKLIAAVRRLPADHRAQTQRETWLSEIAQRAVWRDIQDSEWMACVPFLCEHPKFSSAPDLRVAAQICSRYPWARDLLAKYGTHAGKALPVIEAWHAVGRRDAAGLDPYLKVVQLHDKYLYVEAWKVLFLFSVPPEDALEWGLELANLSDAQLRWVQRLWSAMVEDHPSILDWLREIGWAPIERLARLSRSLADFPWAISQQGPFQNHSHPDIHALLQRFRSIGVDGRPLVLGVLPSKESLEQEQDWLSRLTSPTPAQEKRTHWIGERLGGDLWREKEVRKALRSLEERWRRLRFEQFSTRIEDSIRNHLSSRGWPLSLTELTDRLEVLQELDRLPAADRRLAQKLLAQRAGPPPWDLLDEPENQKFLADMTLRGLRMEHWVEPMETPLGNGSRLELLRDPWEILQMGAWFQTCLSPGDMNFYSTVSNAADMNKQVWAIRRNGKVEARCLVAITDDAQLLRFRWYSHTALEIDKLDDYLTEYAQRLGARLTSRGRVSPLMAKRWYNDGPQEPRRVRRSLVGWAEILRGSDPEHQKSSFYEAFGPAAAEQWQEVLESKEDARLALPILLELPANEHWARLIAHLATLGATEVARTLLEAGLSSYGTPWSSAAKVHELAATLQPDLTLKCIVRQSYCVSCGDWTLNGWAAYYAGRAQETRGNLPGAIHLFERSLEADLHTPLPSEFATEVQTRLAAVRQRMQPRHKRTSNV